jgi:sialate O-acetylesterase
MFRKIILLVLFAIASTSHAAISLPAIISDNMVLQADTDAPIWGKAEPNSTIAITCSWNRKTVEINTDEQGKWTAKIRTPKKGEQLSITITCGKETKTINNILIGDVWLCSGQSNMEMKLKASSDANSEIPKANLPGVRLFSVEGTPSEKPLDDCKGRWVECNSVTASDFSAVGYYFGKEIHEKVKTPIGLIDSSSGGSTAQAWMSKETLQSDPMLNKFLVDDANNQAHKEFYEKQYAPAYKKWREDVVKALAEHKPAPKQPILPNEIRLKYRPCLVYNAMIHPIIPFAIKGVVWYQGESNRESGNVYDILFQTLIRSWRSEWNQGVFPFYYVQLPAYGKIDPNNAKWILIRQAQLKTLDAVANTGMAVTMDVGEANDIHPKNKKPVGHRLALWAMAKTYGVKNIVYSGPLYKDMKIEGDKIRISFKYAEAGLKTPNDEKLKGFVIAGEDGKFVTADAKIQGGEIIVWSEQIKNPKNVRYGWADWIICNLYNDADLPASPFTTKKNMESNAMNSIYKVKRTNSANLKDINWESANTLELKNYMGDKPAHFPKVQAKLLYDDKNIYVCFTVDDQYVRAVAQKTHDMVCRDSCVEFFFTPSENIADGYFNLETNCGGTLLLYHQTSRGQNVKMVAEKDCEKIKMMPSLPKIVEPEIKEPTTWTLRYAMPLDFLEKHAKVTKPAKGVKWYANFYKCADQTSQPHWLTWSKVDLPKPDFHRPEFFGIIEFE